MADTTSIFHREGDFVTFAQFGKKLIFDDTISDDAYYAWLDARIEDIGRNVRGAEIAEKATARMDPRRNSGVYYDTSNFDLLRLDMVLRTTSNPKTHAFCAFKVGENEAGVRQDHRYVFDGLERATIQTDPSGPDAVATVKRLLARRDIMHPGRIMESLTGIKDEDLFPSILLVQRRRTFYVWLDGRDALRCSLDRAEVTNLRDSSRGRKSGRFSEVEVPIYPRAPEEVIKDGRTAELIDFLSGSLIDAFGCSHTTDSKYRRAMKSIDFVR